VATSDPGPHFFEAPAELRDWLDANHATADEVFVGAWKKSTGKFPFEMTVVDNSLNTAVPVQADLVPTNA